MKPIVIIFVALLMLPPVFAGPEAYGYVSINIINTEPRLEDISLSTDMPYFDSNIDCTAKIVDEIVDKVEIKKEWFVNGVKTDSLNVKPGDSVKCVLTPTDFQGLSGASYEYSFQVLDASPDIKFAQESLADLGIRKTTEELEDFRTKGFIVMTRFITRHATI